MKTAMRRRWGDNDRYFGPLTYARDKRYRPLACILASGGEDYPGASLRVSGLGHTVILALPQRMLKPHYEKVQAMSWDTATVARLGRDWYWNVTPREYGFSLSEGFLNVSLGRRTMDSSTEQRWGCFLPWTQWRHVRHSFYGLNGEHIATIPHTGKSYRDDPGRWERERAIADATPTVLFDFDDFDGERITATTKIEEREWRAGTGWFRWLALFRKPRISRSLDIDFSAEVGKRKGSWKGGTTGHSIEMRPGELHAAAFRRYCDENGLRLVACRAVSS